MTSKRYNELTRNARRFTSLEAARSYVNGAHVPMTVITPMSMINYSDRTYMAIHPQFADELVLSGYFIYPYK